MALRVLNPGEMPIGRYDALDSQVDEVLGGEVGTLTGVAVSNSDLAAADVGDGYAPADAERPVVTHTLASGARPLFLIDDGIKHYGTLWGAVVGGTAGQITEGPRLGPHSAHASGKLTVWDKPGLYAVTLDAADTTHNTGLVPQNPNLSVGDPLYATTAGKLTPNSAASFESDLVLGRFVEFMTDGSLVTTPKQLAQDLNEPGIEIEFVQAVFHFNPPV